MFEYFKFIGNPKFIQNLNNKFLFTSFLFVVRANLLYLKILLINEEKRIFAGNFKNKKMRKIAFINGVFILMSILIVSCSSEPVKEKYRHVETIDFDKSFLNLNTLIEGDAHTGKKFSRADVGNNFGFGYTYAIPDSLKGKDLVVSINAWVRTGDLGNNCDLVLSCTSSDSILLWTGCGIKESLKNPNEWTLISKTIPVNANLTAKNNFFINVLGHNIDAKSFFDIDDLVVEYKEVEAQKEAE